MKSHREGIEHHNRYGKLLQWNHLSRLEHRDGEQVYSVDLKKEEINNRLQEQEIQEHFGYKSSNSVVSQLTKLKNKGYVTTASSKEGMKARTLRLVDDVIGVHTVISDELNTALDNLEKRGYKIEINEAVEFLSELKITLETLEGQKTLAKQAS